MADTRTATLIDVSDETMGSALAVAASVSDTTLTLDDTIDFSEAGGLLRLSGVEYVYDEVDKEANTVRLFDPVTVAGEVGVPVDAMSAPGLPARKYVAQIESPDPDGEPIPAVIPVGLIGYFSNVPPDAHVSYTSDGNGYRVVDRPETQAEFNPAELAVQSIEGTDVIRVGLMPWGDVGLEFRREDGTIAFRLRRPFNATDPQTWTFFDRNQNSVLEENPLGVGLRKPSLVLPFQPVAAASGTAVTCGPYGLERTHASTTWTTLFIYDGKAQNFDLDFKFAALCSDGTTSGEIQVVDLATGIPRPGFAAPAWVGLIPTGTTTMTIVDPTPDKVLSTVTDVGPGAYMRLGVQVRRTAGAGTITLAVPQSMGA